MTAPWEYRDPLEATLAADVSAKTLMEHVHTIGAWERESGSPGEALAYDHIERTLKSYGLDVERREIEAYISLPLEGRLRLPDGAVIEGLTHSFSTSAPALEGEVVDVGDGRPEDYARVGAAGKIALVRGLASPGKAWAAQQAGTIGQIFVVMDHLHNMIVTTIWGTPTPETTSRIPATPCLSILGADGARLRERLARGPLTLRLTTQVRTGWMPIPHLVADLRGGTRTASSSSPVTWTPGTTAPWTTARPTRPCWRWRACSRPIATGSAAASASPSGRDTRTAATRAPRGTPTTPGATCISGAWSTSTSIPRARAAPPTTPCCTPRRRRRAWPSARSRT